MGALDPHGMSLSEFWQHLRALSREAFLAEYDHPFLLEITRDTAKPSMNFQTVHDVSRSRIDTDTSDDGIGPQSAVFAICKHGATFPGKITVGRSKNNDLVLTDSRVSKLHAYFLEADGVYWVVDAESSNGTFHNGDRLASMGREKLKNRDQVSFGGTARFVYVDPGHFQRQARFLLQGGDA